MKRARVRHAALMHDLGRRVERLATFKLVEHVSEWNGRETPRLSVRALAEICGCDKNTAMKGVAEAIEKGWITRTEFKNSATFRLGADWFKSSEIFSQSDNGPYDNTVLQIQTLSDASEFVRPMNDPETVRKIQTKKPDLAKSVRNIQTLSGADGECGTGTVVAIRACDSPYPLPLIGNSTIESPQEPPLALPQPEKSPAKKNAAPFDPSKLPNSVFPLWCSIVQLRWRLDAVPEKFAVEAADVARWLVDQRAATGDDFTRFVQWWWHDPDAMGFRQRTRPWPKSVRNNWDTCFSGAERPEQKPAANGNGNGKPTVSERNRASRAGLFAAFGGVAPDADSGPRGRSLELRGPDDPTGRG